MRALCGTLRAALQQQGGASQASAAVPATRAPRRARRGAGVPARTCAGGSGGGGGSGVRARGGGAQGGAAEGGGSERGGKTLVIVESPAKGRTIAGYLGKGYVVEASFGHVRDLVASRGAVALLGREGEGTAAVSHQPGGGGAAQLPAPSEGAPRAAPAPTAPTAAAAASAGECHAVRLEWESLPRSKRVLSSLLRRAEAASRVLLATDPDREGEGIAWHLLEALSAEGVPRHKFQRVSFTQVTADAVRAAVEAPRPLDTALVDAYFARRALDHRLGFSISPVLWSRLPGSKSAGRVQSPALRILCDREDERDAFVPREFWSVKAAVGLQDVDAGASASQPFDVALWRVSGERLGKLDIGDEARANELAERVARCAPYRVSNVERTRQRRSPPAPFITSTLQQSAASSLRWGGQKTMSVAQQLYQGVEGALDVGGLITYMRTDGVNMAPEAVDECRRCAQRLFGADAVPEQPRVYKSKSKNAQEAHECIRPTVMERVPSREMLSFLDTDQLALYALIWRRTIASQMADAVLNKTAAELEPAAGGDADVADVTLRATGSEVVAPGFFDALEGRLGGAGGGASEAGAGDTGGQSEVDGDDSAGRGERFLPALSDGDVCWLASGPDASQHFTRPPPRFNDGSLVKALDEMGIGRPSTYASVISTLAARHYVEKAGKTLVPSARGRVLTLFFQKYFPSLVDYSLTADMENRLDEITAGDSQWEGVIGHFEAQLSRSLAGVADVRTAHINDMLTHELQDIIFERDAEGRLLNGCPEEGCSGTLTIKVSRAGAFVGCTEYPGCTHARDVFSLESEGEESVFAASKGLLGTHPESGHEAHLKRGRFGWYLMLEGATRLDGSKVTCAVPERMQGEPMSLELALKLLGLPREVGQHPELGGAMMTKATARGFNVNHPELGYTSIDKDEALVNKYGGALDAALRLTFDEAVELLKRARKSRFTRMREKKEAAAREAKAAKAAAKKPRAPSAYNLYMKEQLAGDAIDKALPHSERFKLVGEAWKALSEDDRAVYAAESERLKSGIVEANAKVAAKKPRAPSAYNLYMKEQLAGDAIDKALPHSERFKLVGEGWKALSEDDRAVYAAESERLKAEITKAAGGGAE